MRKYLVNKTVIYKTNDSIKVGIILNYIPPMEIRKRYYCGLMTILWRGDRFPSKYTVVAETTVPEMRESELKHDFGDGHIYFETDFLENRI